MSIQCLFDFIVMDAQDQLYPLSKHKGSVTLIVNVASLCVLTDSTYPKLQALQTKFGSRGFTVLAFPCNQFGGQEPGTACAINDWAVKQFKSTFPILGKVFVKGPKQVDLYRFLVGDSMAVQWNFTKFLCGRDGRLIKRFEPMDMDMSVLEREIEKAL